VKTTHWLLVFCTTLLLSSCEQIIGWTRPFRYKSSDLPGFPYTLNKPQKRLFIPYELEEISGITYLAPGLLLCVQDEDGILYTYNVEEDKIQDKVHFHKDGDYEGIALVDSMVYIARSDGAIFKTGLQEEDKEPLKIKTPFKAKNDIEGLCYDKANKRLLIALKGHPGDEAFEGKKAIYALHLDGYSVSDEPAFLIDIEEVSQILEARGQKRKTTNLGPSGIAVHPVSKEIYVLSHIDNVLIVLRPNGAIEQVLRLDRRMFRQPEGITFAPDGTMYISNEGDGDRASILEFRYMPQQNK
jgi:uncharacterized protein YjiK